MKIYKYNNKVIRDTLLAFLVITNFVLLLFLLLNSVMLSKEIEVEASIDQQYNKHITAALYSNSENDNFTSATVLEALCNYKMVHAKMELSVPIGDTSVGHDVTIVFSDSEKLPAMQDTAVREYTSGLFVGEAITQLLDKENKLYLFDDSYVVSGTFRNEVAGGYDDRVTIFWNSLTENSRKSLQKELMVRYEMGMAINVSLDADEDLDDISMQLSEELSALGLDMDITDSSRNVNYLSWLYQIFSKIGLGCVGLFSIINCCVVSNVWVAQNKKLLAILKALGYRNKDIYWFMLKELFHYIVIAIPITFVLQWIYMIVIEQHNMINILYGIPVILIGIIFVLIISAWIPLVFIFKKTPVEVMRMR